MRAKEKIEMLESRIKDLTDRLDQVTGEKEEALTEISSLKRKLEQSLGKAAELEEQLEDRDLEQLKEEVRTKRVEYEGLKELYNRKIQDFDSSKEVREQEFAKEEAVSRYNLENEIRDNRQANQEFVAGTVKEFSNSFNYYLNQIKMLMDTLGDVASQTGESLFLGENQDLKAQIGQKMAEKLRNETDDLRDGDGLVLIAGSAEDSEEAEQIPDAADEAAEEAEQIPDAADDAAEEAEQIPDAADEAAEEAEQIPDTADEAAEEAEQILDTADDAAEETEQIPDTAVDAAEEAAPEDTPEDTEDTFAEPDPEGEA